MANRETFSKQLIELLDVTPEKSREIMNAFVTTLTTALQNGDEIKIDGFGIFRRRRLKPQRTSGNWIAQGIQSNVPIVKPARDVVVFVPAEPLQAMMNVNTTCVERRSRAYWNKNENN